MHLRRYQHEQLAIDVETYPKRPKPRFGQKRKSGPMPEGLRPSTSYPGWYASPEGHVWSILVHRWISPCIDKVSGYWQTKYAGRTVGIHQVVADAFLGPCPEGYEVNHKDLRKGHNMPGNLEYLTHRENIQHAYHMRAKEASFP